MENKPTTKAWDWLGRVDSIQSLWTWGKPYVVAAASAIIAGAVAIWAFVRELSGPAIFALFVFTAASAVWLLLGLVLLVQRGSKPDQPASEPAPPPVDSDRALLLTRQRDLMELRLTAAQSDVAVLTQQFEEAQAGRERERIDKEALANEVQTRESTIRTMAEHFDDALWRESIGTERPQLPDWFGSENLLVVERLQELSIVLDPAAEKCFELLDALLARWQRAHGNSHAQYFLAGLVAERVWERGRNAWRALVSTLNQRRDPREALIGFYIRYQSARSWLFRFAELQDWPADIVAAYSQWRIADAAFEEELKKALARSSLRPVAGYIDGVHREPAPPHPESMPAKYRLMTATDGVDDENRSRAE
jgi:hypothetical protein